LLILLTCSLIVALSLKISIRYIEWSGIARIARKELKKGSLATPARIRRQTGPAQHAIFAIQLETPWRDVEEAVTPPTGGMSPKVSPANAVTKKLAGDAITVTSIMPKDSPANVEIKRLIGDV
jgi:hypothetical protein